MLTFNPFNVNSIANCKSLVNDQTANNITRFKLSLSDGAVIPILEKKYTAVKRKLLEYNVSVNIHITTLKGLHEIIFK